MLSICKNIAKILEVYLNTVEHMYVDVRTIFFFAGTDRKTTLTDSGNIFIICFHSFITRCSGDFSSTFYALSLS